MPVVHPLNGDDVRLSKKGNTEHLASITKWKKRSRTAYADLPPTDAIMVMITCSFRLNGPGLSEMPKIFF